MQRKMDCRYPAVRLWMLAGIALCALSNQNCATNPATGKTQLALITEAQEIAMGRQSDQQIVESIGVYQDPGLQSYVEMIGLELAAKSERPNLPWSFRVLDDPTVNAFALPGGFIYVTRGILAHLNSEAELATVIGHEIGHVTARHSVSQLSKQQLATIGLGIGMVVAPELRGLGDAAQQGLGLMFLKFGRDDERQADDLGFRYLSRGNYDPRESADVFRMLSQVSQSAGAGRLPGWLSTHPDPVARAERASGWSSRFEGDINQTRIGEELFMKKIDGMVYGPNPRLGYFVETAFKHPDLEFKMNFPAGWQTQNQTQAVVGISSEKDAIVQMTLSQEADPEAAARKFLAQEGLTAGRVQSRKINGFRAAWGDFSATSGQSEVRGRVAFLRDGERTYSLLGYSLASVWSSREPAIGRWINSFDRLRDPAALAVQPARLEVVQLDNPLSLDQFQKRYPSDLPTDTVGLINQVGVGSSFADAGPAKRVVGGKLP